MNLLKKGMLTKAAYGILTAAMAVFIASGCTPRKDKADSQNESVQKKMFPIKKIYLR